jgi:hypothetical protein
MAGKVRGLGRCALCHVNFGLAYGDCCAFDYGAVLEGWATWGQGQTKHFA